MTQNNKSISPLRRRMIEDMSMRKLSPKTQRAYIRAVKDFTRFFGRSPEQALINPDNLLILLSHLRCAVFELPFHRCF